MGIQAWFIILGVGAMTLIVLDGKRCKRKQRVSDVSVPPQHLSAVSSSPEHSEFHKEISPLEAFTATEGVDHHHQGSRIGVATHIAGKVIADEPVLIKGRVTGTVIAPNHSVTVTSTGYVASYLEGSRVDIDGHVEGVLKANTKATLLACARIKGVIEAPRLECIAGAWLNVEVAQQAARNRPKVAMVS